MAKVMTGDYIATWQKKVICTHPTLPLTGNLCRVGIETGIALTSEATTDTGLSGNLTGYTTVMVGPFRAKVPVKGVNDLGNSAVADGDNLYYVDTDVNDGTGFLSKKRSGYFFGTARGAVTSGSTTSIEVDHIPSTAPGTLNLSALQETGFIPLHIYAARIIASNDIAAKGTPDGGIISLDTDPTFKRVNGATDKALRIAWAASSVVPIQWGGIVLPPDIDITANLTVNLIMAMAGATDTPTVAVNYLNNALGTYAAATNAGGNTAAITGVSVIKYTRTILAANLTAAQSFATIELVPGAHTTDALYLYGAYLTYSKI